MTRRRANAVVVTGKFVDLIAFRHGLAAALLPSLLVSNLSCAAAAHQFSGITVVEGDPPALAQEPRRKPSCERADLLPFGESVLRLQVDGVERLARVYVPDLAFSEPAPTEAGLPLVLNFHGTGGSAHEQAELSRLNPLAEEFGVVVAYPEGLPLEGEQVFDAGPVRDFSSAPRDDVAFARALVAHISKRYCIDATRIYSMGMSNGARMSYRLACEASDLIAAIAPIAGMLTVDPKSCHPTHPVSALHFHGIGDRVSNYMGGGVRAPRSVPANFELWAQKTGCKGPPTRVSESSASHCDAYTSCEGGAQVRLCSIEVMGHCWPGNPRCGMGEGSTELDASRLSLEFLLQFQNRPADPK